MILRIEKLSMLRARFGQGLFGPQPLVSMSRPAGAAARRSALLGVCPGLGAVLGIEIEQQALLASGPARVGLGSECLPISTAKQLLPRHAQDPCRPGAQD